MVLLISHFVIEDADTYRFMIISLRFQMKCAWSGPQNGLLLRLHFALIDICLSSPLALKRGVRVLRSFDHTFN